MNLSLAPVLTVIAILFAWTQTAFAISIDFEDLPVDTAIGYKYAAKGVVFSQYIAIGTNAASRTAPNPHSGAQLAQQFEGEFNSTPLYFDFTNGQRHVTLYGCTVSRNATGILRVFDGAGKLIAQDGPKALTDAYCNTLFDLRSTNPNIKHVEFSAFIENTAAPDLEIDDLTFEGGIPPPPPPTDTPLITITSPVDGGTVDATSVTLSGSVKGNGLVPQMLVTVDHLRMPWDQPPDLYSVPLAGTGTTRTFSQAIRMPLGGVTITAKADNIGGKEGTAAVRLTNLPKQLVNLDGSLGALKGVLDASPACRIAIYADGALAWDGTNVFTINPTMLPKWTGWASQTLAQGLHPPRAFCPTENAHFVLGNVSRQNFLGGRLYDDAGNVYYVPAVFAQAIDVLGGEAGTGTPMGDPQVALGAHTWVFQRFVRPQGGLPSTIEIKGSPPVLYVERQAGDLTALTVAGLPLTMQTATIVDHFPCSGIGGPCAIEAPVSGPRVTDAGNRFCKGTTTLTLAPPAGPDEWVPILQDGHLKPTHLLGWVSESRPAGQDLTLSHEFIQTHSDGTLWADWDLFVHPVEPFRFLLAGNDFMEVEFEYYPAQYFFIAYDGQPLVGDLYFAAGRWIIDCGHSDYSSEIHPPFISARIRTDGAGDGARTLATFWVNGYYYSGQQVDFQVFPPPRPTPTSFLTVSLPRASDVAVDVTVIDPLDPAFGDPDFAAFVLARFSATPKHIDIGWGGLLPFSSGRVYEGTWTVGWENETQYQVGSLSPWWWP